MNLKQFIIIILTFFLFFNNANAEKVVYANMDFIIKNSEVGKKIITYFSKKNETLIDNIKSNEVKLKDKENNLIAQKNILDEKEYIKKVDFLKLEIKEFNENNTKQINQINLEREQVSKEFINEIRKIINVFAENNNIDLVLSSSQILIGKNNLDVTNDILKLVNDKIKNFEIKINE